MEAKGTSAIHNPRDIIDEGLAIHNVPKIMDRNGAFIMMGAYIIIQLLYMGERTIYNGSAIIKKERWGNVCCMTAIYKIDGLIVVGQLSTSHLRQLSILYISAGHTLVVG